MIRAATTDNQTLRLPRVHPSGWRPVAGRDHAVFFWGGTLAMRKLAAKKVRITVLFLLGAIFCSCGPPQYVYQTPEQLREADYGPSPRNYEGAVKSRFKGTLFDPDSAVYEFSSPTQAWYRKGQTILYGWAVCGTVNAKDRYGAYVGPSPFYVLIRNEEVVVVLREYSARITCMETGIPPP
jgi:hypothetical protein